MESENVDDRQLLAIMEFLSHYDQNVSVSTLFSGESLCKLITSVQDDTFDFRCNIEVEASHWTNRLLNF